MTPTQEILNLAEGLAHNNGRMLANLLRELVKERQDVERVQGHIALAIQFIEANYPGTKLLDAGPVMKNLRNWRDKLNLGQPKGALHDDIIKYRKLCKAFDDMKTSTSVRFLECLGIYDADVCLPFDELWRPT